MSKWYKSALVKGILIFLSVLSAITALLSLVIISTYSVSVKEIWNKKPTEYTDSKEFENQMCRATMDVLGQISYEDIFETDGKYNPDKLIDIMQYGYNGRHYDEETERLRYKLSDLQKWSEEYQNNYATQENPIVVCQKADKTYHYYYWDEFLSLLKKKTLTVDIDGYTSDEIVNALASGNVSLSQFAGHDILDEKGETVYRDFWGFSGAIEEEAWPDGGNNILDVVNQTPQLNGKLSEVYAQLGSILSNLYYDFQSYQNSAEWTEGNTNFAYIFVDKETKKVYTNRKEYQDYNSVKENISDIQKNAKYMIVQPKLSDFKTNMDITANDWKEFVKSQRRNSNGDFIFAAAVDTRFSIQDSFYLDKKLYDEYAPYINRAVILLGAAVLLIIVSLIWLTVIAGRNNRSDGVHLNVFDRWKTELAAVFVIVIWIIPMMFWMNNGNMALGYFAESTDLMTATIGYSYEYASGYVPTMQDMIQLACTAAYTMIMFLVGYLSLVRRINTLSSIIVLAENGDSETVVKMCRNLSRIMRYITNTTETTVTLKDELDYVQKYLYCMKVRYQSSLNYSIHVDESLLSQPVPKLIIQPIVENAIRYGSNCAPPWNISITSMVTEGSWQIEVTDSGPGFTEEAKERITANIMKAIQNPGLPELKINGLGTINVYLRWKIFCKGDIIFRYGNTAEGHGIVSIGRYFSKTDKSADEADCISE